MACDHIRLVCMVLHLLLVVAESGQRHFILLAASLVLRADILHAIRMLQILILVWAPGTQLLYYVSDTSVYLPEHVLYILIHAHFSVVVYAFYSRAQFPVKMFC